MNILLQEFCCLRDGTPDTAPFFAEPVKSYHLPAMELIAWRPPKTYESFLNKPTTHGFNYFESSCKAEDTALREMWSGEGGELVNLDQLRPFRARSLIETTFDCSENGKLDGDSYEGIILHHRVWQMRNGPWAVGHPRISSQLANTQELQECAKQSQNKYSCLVHRKIGSMYHEACSEYKYMTARY